MHEPLFPAQWEFLLESILRINSCETISNTQLTSLDLIRRAVPFDMGTFYLAIKNSNGRIEAGNPVTIGIEEDFINEYMDQSFFSMIHSMKLENAIMPKTVRDADFLSNEIYLKSPLFKNFYEKIGIRYAVTSFLVEDHEPLGMISLLKRESSGDFEDSEIEIIRLLSPHISQKLKFTLRMDAREAKTEAGVALLSKRYKLTIREQQILACVLNGLDDDRIIENLHITQSTLRKHLGNIYKKTNTHSRMKLISLGKSAVVN